jgi:hypothetical protein
MKKMPLGLQAGLRRVTSLCCQGLISWDEKEELCDKVLAIWGWTREELREYNKERENEMGN